MLGNNGGGTSGMACTRQLLVFHQWQWFSGVGASMPGIMRCMRQSCVAGAACGSLWFFINGSGSVGWALRWQASRAASGSRVAGAACGSFWCFISGSGSVRWVLRLCVAGAACGSLLASHQWQWFSGMGSSMASIMRCMRQLCVAGAACGSLWCLINVVQWCGFFDGRRHGLHAAVLLSFFMFPLSPLSCALLPLPSPSWVSALRLG